MSYQNCLALVFVIVTVATEATTNRRVRERQHGSDGDSALQQASCRLVVLLIVGPQVSRGIVAATNSGTDVLSLIGTLSSVDSNAAIAIVAGNVVVEVVRHVRLSTHAAVSRSRVTGTSSMIYNPANHVPLTHERSRNKARRRAASLRIVVWRKEVIVFDLFGKQDAAVEAKVQRPVTRKSTATGTRRVNRVRTEWVRVDISGAISLCGQACFFCVDYGC